MASAIEELNFKFYFILSHFNSKTACCNMVL